MTISRQFRLAPAVRLPKTIEGVSRPLDRFGGTFLFLERPTLSGVYIGEDMNSGGLRPRTTGGRLLLNNSYGWVFFCNSFANLIFFFKKKGGVTIAHRLAILILSPRDLILFYDATSKLRTS
jgi:hypothetical protein